MRGAATLPAPVMNPHRPPSVCGASHAPQSQLGKRIVRLELASILPADVSRMTRLQAEPRPGPSTGAPAPHVEAPAREHAVQAPGVDERPPLPARGPYITVVLV